jgi:hypothetical protein
MARSSDPLFRTHHALRIKGFAPVETVAEVAGTDAATARSHLEELRDRDHAQFREARSLWQLTPEGRNAHAAALKLDVDGFDLSVLNAAYRRFLELNEQFKVLCGDWQLRDGATNDHSDQAYDDAIVERLVLLDAEVRPIAGTIAAEFERFVPYGPRLEGSCRKVQAGETKMLTGVMCGSYHDVWMEMHEDLILTQGIDRAKEGSF